MASLAVFDFDRTIVDGDSDATIINKLREKRTPPEWDAGSNDWTPYMSNVFEHAYSSGLSQDDILDSIASMQPTAGLEELINTLSSEGWDILIITDANTVFTQHWLKTHGLLNLITEIITNRAFWHNGRLYIEPCMNQSSCPRCPSNLCKSVALAEWCSQRAAYSTIVYSGDGGNDFCPSTNVPANGIVFPRKGYPLDDRIKKSLASPNPQIKARVVPWVDCYTILQELYPNKTQRLGNSTDCS